MTEHDDPTRDRMKHHFAQRVIHQARLVLEIWQQLTRSEWTGAGMGDLREGSGGIGTGTVSGYPREDESSYYWLYRGFGQGLAPTSILGTGNVSAPSNMALYMNQNSNAFGTSAYLAGALAARVLPIEWLALAIRGDFFWENVPTNAMGTASSIFWPVEWVGSATASVELLPHDHVSFRLEYRHDEAAGTTCDGSATQVCAYFAGAVSGDGRTMPYLRNASRQDTITLGATTWF